MPQLNRTTDYYYEAHVIIEPVVADLLDHVTAMAASHSFAFPRTADTFGALTSRSINQDDMALRTQHLVRALQSSGIVVRRYKIEETLCDSNLADTLELLPD